MYAIEENGETTAILMARLNKELMGPVWTIDIVETNPRFSGRNNGRRLVQEFVNDHKQDIIKAEVKYQGERSSPAFQAWLEYFNQLGFEKPSEFVDYSYRIPAANSFIDKTEPGFSSKITEAIEGSIRSLKSSPKTMIIWLNKFLANMAETSMKAELPMGVFVSETTERLSGVQFDATKYLPVVITTAKGNEKYLDNPTTKNFGINAGEGPVYFNAENGVVRVYINAEGAGFAVAASQVVAALRGYGNLEADPRALKILGVNETAGENAVVFDYTGGALNKEILSDTPVVPGENINIGFAAIRELDRAHKNAQAPAEIGIERAWSEELLDHKKIDSFNNSIVIPASDISKMTIAKVRELQNRGARIHVIYEGSDTEQARALAGKAAALGMNGIFCPGLDTKAMNALDEPKGLNAVVAAELALPKDKGREASFAATNNKMPDGFIIAGKFAGGRADRRRFYQLDLSDADYASQIAAIQNSEFPVIRVKLGQLPEADARKRIEALKGLPASSIIIFIADDIKDNGMFRDITEVNIFGANLLKFLRLTPRTTAEKEDYQRRVAFGIDLGEFEEPGNMAAYLENITSERLDLIACPENTEMLAAAKLHLSEQTDPSLKEVFKQALISRVRARIELVKHHKPLGLANTALEETLAQALDLSNGQPVMNSSFAGEKTTAETEEALNDSVQSWKSLSNREAKTARAAEMAGLILQYADPRAKKLDRKYLRSNDFRNTKAILEAA
jgi:hypothetical protein